MKKIPNLLLWHYTVAQKYDLILKDGEIKQATKNVKKNERPVVWFSKSQEWEPVCNKGIRLPDGKVKFFNSIEEHLEFGGAFTPVRIGVSINVAPYGWKEFCSKSGIEKEMAHALYKTAVTLGSDPFLWRVSFIPVPSRKWLKVQVYKNGSWVDMA